MVNNNNKSFVLLSCFVMFSLFAEDPNSATTFSTMEKHLQHCIEMEREKAFIAAEEQNPPSASIVNSETEDCCCDTTSDCPPDICAYNAPVLYSPCAYTNFYITGSFLYWRASGDYLAYALV